MKIKTLLTQEQFEARLLKMPLDKVLKYLDQVEATDALILAATKAEGTAEQVAAFEKEISYRKKERFQFACLHLFKNQSQKKNQGNAG